MIADAKLTADFRSSPKMKVLTRRQFRRSFACLAVLTGLAVVTFAPAPAAAQGTPEQRAACSGDAQRLCGQFIPDVDRITACMSRNRRHLSPGCRRVFR
jgi:hypothetical protein